MKRNNSKWTIVLVRVHEGLDLFISLYISAIPEKYNLTLDGHTLPLGILKLVTLREHAKT